MFSVAFASLLALPAVAAEGVPLSEHPRPDWERAEWLNLNGMWDFGFRPGEYDRQIVVPFGWGSPLSRVKDEGDTGYYRRTVVLPKEWKSPRAFLVVGACDWEAGGFMAVSTIDRMLRGFAVGMRLTFKPLGVIGRESTARTSEVVNARVVKAVDAIRSRACRGLKAWEVVNLMGCSRRLAEMRFREVTGKSILEEIRRVRYENARLLLSQTDVPMAVVANRSGWASLPSFCRGFKEMTGLTPMDWRRKCDFEP